MLRALKAHLLTRSSECSDDNKSDAPDAAQSPLNSELHHHCVTRITQRFPRASHDLLKGLKKKAWPYADTSCISCRQPSPASPPQHAGLAHRLSTPHSNPVDQQLPTITPSYLAASTSSASPWCVSCEPSTRMALTSPLAGATTGYSICRAGSLLRGHWHRSGLSQRGPDHTNKRSRV